MVLGGKDNDNGNRDHEDRRTGAAPVTGHGEDPAKFGFERRGGDADWATEAQIENNLDPVYELVDGRCSYDGLPEGNCAHFPGPQDATFPGEPVGEDYDGPLTREDGSTAVSAVPPAHGRDDQAAVDQRKAREDEQHQNAGPDYPAKGHDKDKGASKEKDGNSGR